MSAGERALPAGVGHAAERSPTRGAVAFEAPWELRAFALAVAAHREGHYDWATFQRELATAVGRWEDAPPDRAHAGESWHYYDRWVEALEAVLADLGVETDATGERAARILATPRDAEHQRAKRDPVAVDPAR